MTKQIDKTGNYYLPPCMQQPDNEAYVVKYEGILKFEDEQAENFWTWREPKVEKDIHTIRTGLDEAEKHGVLTTLKLFTLYELFAGNEYWGGRYSTMFPRLEFQRVAAIHKMTELCIHAPFYNSINQLLRIDTEEFYMSYKTDVNLKKRMDFIGSIVDSDDDLLSLGVFSMLEGATLYTNFAYLKHFQTNGKNKLGAIVSGLDFSLRDESGHSICGAVSFQLAIREIIEDNLLINKNYLVELGEKLKEAAIILTEHEDLIVDEINSKGNAGLSSSDMKAFNRSRINLCMVNLGYDNIYTQDETTNNIESWFYKNINMPTVHDFFVNLGSQYKRGADEKSFVVPKNKYKFVG